MGRIAGALKWLEKNSAKLGRKYKNQWLLVNNNGVVKHSASYARIASSSGPEYVLVKVPRNPQASFVF